MRHLKLFGGIVVEDDGGVVAGLASRRHPLALLALLATAPSRTLGRGTLAGLLWPESPEKKARSRLNTCVYHVRRALGEDVLISVGDELRLDDEALACDVCRFEEAVEAGDWSAAANLYGGPFLQGFDLGGSPAFEKWTDRERGRLRRSYQEALEALGDAAEERGRPEAAVRWWWERADQDPFDSRVACRLMQALAAAGNRAEALRVAREHQRRLVEELGTGPSAEVRALSDRLRSSAGTDAGPAEGDPSSTTEPRGAAPGRAVGTPELPAPPRSFTSRGAPVSPAPWGSRQLAGALGVVGLVAVLGTATWYLAGAGGEEAAPPLDRSIAVLPFESVGAGDGTALTEGLDGELLHRLGALSGLRVISRTSVRRLGTTSRALPEVAEELGVAWVLRGDVQRVGERVQVNVRLMDAREDRQVWSESYRRELSAGDLFEIQEDVTREIAAALRTQLSPTEERRIAAIPTRSTAAYELFLQARKPDEYSPATEEGTERRVALYRRALELDPEFAEAWAWLADAYSGLGWIDADGEGWADSARAAARRALELDPELADAWAQLGDARWALGRPSGEILEAYRRALELQPNNREAANNLLVLLARQGRFAEKMKWAERLAAISPESPGYLAVLVESNALLGRDEAAAGWLAHARRRGHHLIGTEFAVALYHQGRTDRARELLDELRNGPEGAEPVRLLRREAALALYEEDWTEARRRYRTLYQGLRPTGGVLFQGLLHDGLGLAYALERLGSGDEARELAAEIARATREQMERTSTVHAPQHRLAVSHLILGDTTEALEWLERAVDAGYRNALVMSTVPTLEPLRDHPRFRELLELVEGLVAEERRWIEAEGWGEAPP